jgi:hypothetical protein
MVILVFIIFPPTPLSLNHARGVLPSLDALERRIAGGLMVLAKECGRFAMQDRAQQVANCKGLPGTVRNRKPQARSTALPRIRRDENSGSENVTEINAFIRVQAQIPCH